MASTPHCPAYVWIFSLFACAEAQSPPQSAMVASMRLSKLENSVAVGERVHRSNERSGRRKLSIWSGLSLDVCCVQGGFS